MTGSSTSQPTITIKLQAQAILSEVVRPNASLKQCVREALRRASVLFPSLVIKTVSF